MDDTLAGDQFVVSLLEQRRGDVAAPFRGSLAWELQRVIAMGIDDDDVVVGKDDDNETMVEEEEVEEETHLYGSLLALREGKVIAVRWIFLILTIYGVLFLFGSVLLLWPSLRRRRIRSERSGTVGPGRIRRW